MERHQDTMSLIWRTALAVLLSAGFGCSDDPAEVVEGPPLPRITEDQVLHNLQVAWRQQDADKYADILADDFRYYPDEFTRQDLGVESWDRETELAYVRCLFNSSIVTGITVELSWPARSAAPAGFTGTRETWTRLFLTNVFLDVDYMPVGEETNTYRVEDETQRFYFRKGRTFPPSGPPDTSMYLVEWRDDGSPDRKSSFQAVLPSSWSQLKLLGGDCE